MTSDGFSEGGWDRTPPQPTALPDEECVSDRGGNCVRIDRRHSLGEPHRALLRDWYDTSGTWVVKMSSLYRLVEEIVETEMAKRPTPDSDTPA